MLTFEQITEVMSVSIVDVIGSNNGGVSLMLNLMIFNTPYDIAYFFNKEGDIRLVPEQTFLDRLGLDDIYEYEFLDEFVYFIHNNIPNMDKIIEEYLK